jgi:RNA polymerase sigma-70 factor, ECF subfamily
MAMERETIVQLLLRERLRLTAVASAIVRDVHAADDVFQQVVLAALQAPTEFQDPGHVLAWSIRAARHRAIDLAQTRKLLPLSEDVLDLLEAEWADPAPGAWSDRAEALHHCMGRLAGPARELLKMRYTDGLTAVSIARKLRRTADAVYQTLSRIHRALRDCVERELGRVEKPAERGVS